MDFSKIVTPTKEEFEQIEKQYPNCEWVEIKGETPQHPAMSFAFKPFNVQVYYASLDTFRRTESLSDRNLSMTTGHIINGLDAYMNNSRIRALLDYYTQTQMINVSDVSFKKKPTFAELKNQTQNEIPSNTPKVQ